MDLHHDDLGTDKSQAKKSNTQINQSLSATFAQC
jgi:hypothetical protein